MARQPFSRCRLIGSRYRASLEYSSGLEGRPHLSLFHFLSDMFIAGGFVLIGALKRYILTSKIATRFDESWAVGVHLRRKPIALLNATISIFFQNPSPWPVSLFIYLIRGNQAPPNCVFQVRPKCAYPFSSVGRDLYLKNIVSFKEKLLIEYQASQVPTKQDSRISSLVWPVIAGLIIVFLVVFTFNASWGTAGLIGLIVFLIGNRFWLHDSQDE